MKWLATPKRAVITMLTAATLLSACSAAITHGGSSTTAGSPATVAVGTADGGATSVYNANTDPVVQAIKQVSPAVVNITSRVQTTNPFFGGSSTSTGTGTGFIVRSDGVIVTNDHVVEGASSIKVTLNAPDGRSFPATVLSADSQHDLAVLKVNASALPTVTIGSSSQVRLGQRVIALGYALDLKGGPTVTSGIVSSLDRTIQVQDPNAGPSGSRTYRDILQTDAAINPGNSGGPLINLAGQVIGIDSAGTQQAQNIGFAIAIDSAKPIIAQATS
ncbi:MAG: trypsin-like peptidase domain-containing protein [Actinomycetota bacterium]|nr:trypsin-like peptidase domain-containing protein [Actinomycetota bacterium]